MTTPSRTQCDRDMSSGSALHNDSSQSWGPIYPSDSASAPHDNSPYNWGSPSSLHHDGDPSKGSTGGSTWGSTCPPYSEEEPGATWGCYSEEEPGATWGCYSEEEPGVTWGCLPERNENLKRKREMNGENAEAGIPPKRREIEYQKEGNSIIPPKELSP